jgi:hypothetical protein
MRVYGGECPHNDGNLCLGLPVLTGDRLQHLRDGFELTCEDVSLRRQWIVGVTQARWSPAQGAYGMSPLVRRTHTTDWINYNPPAKCDSPTVHN